MEQQRQAQQQASEAEAARQIAAQQEAARRDTDRQDAERQATARREAEQRQQQAAAQQAAAARATPAAAPSLRPVSTPAPRYPADALRSGTSGEVLVEITVGTDGSVTNARVLRANPARVFDREALNAVKRWKFEPVGALSPPAAPWHSPRKAVDRHAAPEEARHPPGFFVPAPAACPAPIGASRLAFTATASAPDAAAAPVRRWPDRWRTRQVKRGSGSA